MCPVKTSKEEYVTPEGTVYTVSLQRHILDVSKPEGTVPPVDPTEE